MHSQFHLKTLRLGDSVRSRTKKDSASAAAWEAAPATDFAITTINVPDRLDMQEVRAREAEDEYYRRPRFALDRYSVVLWTRRALIAAVLLAIAWLIWAATVPLLRDLSPEAIAARLSAGTGQPVTIADRDFSVWPQPRLVLRGVRLGTLTADQVSLQPSWSELVLAARTGRWSAIEAVVGAMRIDASQAWALVALVPRLAAASGPGVSAIRLSEVTFAELPLLPGRYEAVLRQPLPTPALPPVTLRQLDGTGQMQLQLAPGQGGFIDFKLDAQNWRAPFGPAVDWAWVNASGRVAPNLLFVDGYTAASPVGVAQGLLVAASDVGWSVAGTAESVGVDLTALWRYLGGQRAGEEQGSPAVSGTASIAFGGGGHGASLEEAIAAARLTGPVSVRWAALNGINLGVVATQGGASIGGGSTRLTQLTAEAALTRDALALTQIAGRAGALAMQGQLTVGSDLGVDGRLRVELGMTRVQAPAALRVSGTALAPHYGQ